ncbi:MAG: hypothetical protein KatS3mg105_0709 [Gemmatales bacterium]|nr:MAG: hypothetical protein KatS3mg105_0709 [Gemmatales bacterium]
MVIAGKLLEYRTASSKAIATIKPPSEEKACV